MKRKIDLDTAVFQLFEACRQRDILLSMLEPYKKELGRDFDEILGDIQLFDYKMNNDFIYLDVAHKQHQSGKETSKNIDETKCDVDFLGDGYAQFLESNDDILGYKVKNGIVCDECAWNGVKQEDLEQGEYETITRKDTLDKEVFCDACGQRI
jgi:hypothetical protein